MQRHLISSLVLMAAGFSSQALADSDIESSVSGVVADTATDEAAEKKARKPATKKPARAPAPKAKSQARPAKPATSTNPAKPRVSPSTSSQSSRPVPARPAATPAASDRQPVHGSSSQAQKRPSTKARPAGQGRPAGAQGKPPAGQVQVHRRPNVPPRWTPQYHRYHMRGVPRHHPRYWSAGVFYYNPPPKRHKVVVVHDGGQTASGPNPTRAIDRSNSFGVGLSSGSYNSGYKAGGGYGDMGIGLTATYRPIEAVGFELAWTHYDQSWDESSERIHEPVQASVNLYAFPWTRVSPYVTLGLTQTGRDVEDTWFDGYSQQTTTTEQTVFGPHAGLGLEFALGSTAAFDLEARHISYLDVEQGDPSARTALQGTMGLKFYF